MIPKVIHYCWFGGNPLPESAIKCIKSWKKHCPDYEISEWNEENCDIESMPLYVRQAYAAKKWAFVTDYVRLKIVYEHGGIYLDTDVELLKNPNKLCEYSAYFGFENPESVATGLGFGAEKGCSILAEMMHDYAAIPFVTADGSFDLTACPQRNTHVLQEHGLCLNGRTQVLDDNVCVLAPEFLCPLNYSTGENKRTRKTISIHWFAASWQPEEQKSGHIEALKKTKRRDLLHNLVHTPNRWLLFCLGEASYNRLKHFLRRG